MSTTFIFPLQEMADLLYSSLVYDGKLPSMGLGNGPPATIKITKDDNNSWTGVELTIDEQSRG